MNINQDFKDLLQCLNEEQVEYLIVGAYAVVFYTEPRYTKDLDIWVNSNLENAKKVYAALEKFGAPLSGITLDDLSNPSMVYQIGIAPNRIDILMGIEGLEFQKAWKDRTCTQYGDTSTALLSAEDLKTAKKAASRPQDLIDLAKIEEFERKRKSQK